MNRTFLTYQQLRTASPIRQGIAITLVSIVCIILFSLVSNNVEVEWFIAITTLGFYTWTNSVLSFFRKTKKIQYFLLSVLVFLIMSAVLWLVADTLSSIDVFTIRAYVLLYMIVCVFYVCAMLVVTLIRKIADAMGIVGEF